MPVDLATDDRHGKAGANRADHVQRAHPGTAETEVANEVLDKDRDGIGLPGTGHDQAQHACRQNDPAIEKRHVMDEAAPTRGTAIGRGQSGGLQVQRSDVKGANRRARTPYTVSRWHVLCSDIRQGFAMLLLNSRFY
ncbi:hypothetical protein C2W62_17010 [Candidatus Entotheonella serta]|nr:hypothetical protein C2W62_17010 [Candidatus Entotheonella serta]